MTAEKLAVGTRVMWVYGRVDYAEYGEIGTIVAHTDDGVNVLIDDEQPFSRATYGAKAKKTGHERIAEFTSDDVRPLAEVYRTTAKRWRAVAESWDEAASAVEESKP